jgi:hypothetical protein
MYLGHILLFTVPISVIGYEKVTTFSYQPNILLYVCLIH